MHHAARSSGSAASARFSRSPIADRSPAFARSAIVMGVASSCEIIAITDSRICIEPLLTRIERLAQAGVHAIILREKHLDPARYRALARDALAIVAGSGVRCVLHGFPEVALELGAAHYHCQSAEIPKLRAYRGVFEGLGVSVHSRAEYRAASAWADYVIAGHVFPTRCKAGMPARGIALLEDILADMADMTGMAESSHIASLDSRGDLGVDCGADSGVLDSPIDSGGCALFGVGGIGLENAKGLRQLRRLMDSSIEPHGRAGRDSGLGRSKEGTQKGKKHWIKKGIQEGSQKEVETHCKAKLKGICLRGALMRCQDPARYIHTLREILAR